MPHIIVKMYAGKSEAQKQEFTAAIVQAAQQILGSTDASLSVTIEDVAPADWAEQVYHPDIQPHLERLYKKPGYTL